MANWYLGSTNWTAVTAWAAATAYSVGDIRRQLAAPTVGNERVWRCTTAGTSGGAEPAWTLTKGSTTNDNTAVWTEVTGNSTYGWNAAHARLSNAFAWAAAGDTIWTSDNHAATQATTLTLTSPGTAADPVYVVCVDDTSGTPPTTVATTATESTTGSISIAVAGFAYFYGFSLSCGSGGGTSNLNVTSGTPFHWHMEACGLHIAATSSACRINVGATNAEDDQLLELVDTEISFAHVGQSFLIRSPMVWSGGELSGTAPTVLYRFGTNGAQPYVQTTGVDLSIMGAGTSLVDQSILNPAEFKFQGCKLGSSVAVVTGTHPGPGGSVVELILSDSGDTNTRYEKYDYRGSVVTETTIVLDDGASDGTTQVSHKFVSSANSDFHVPLYGPWMSFWNETTGSGVTVGAEVITDNVTLKDGEAWIEVEYLGTSGFPKLARSRDRVASILGMPGANQASSVVTWTTTGLGTPVKQRLATTFTPQEKGVIRGRVVLAKVSTTMYVDPYILP